MATKMPIEGTYRVFSPEGPRDVLELRRPKQIALHEAVIGQLWDMAFKGDLIFAEVRESLNTLYPSTSFIDYREFGDIHGPRERDVLRELPEKLARFRCSGVVAGVGA